MVVGQEVAADVGPPHLIGPVMPQPGNAVESHRLHTRPHISSPRSTVTRHDVRDTHDREEGAGPSGRGGRHDALTYTSRLLHGAVVDDVKWHGGSQAPRREWCLNAGTANYSLVRADLVEIPPQQHLVEGMRPALIVEVE